MDNALMATESKDQRLAGRGALVTGAGEGIGRATALLFAAEGAHVGVLDIEPDRVEETVGEIARLGGAALPLPVDVAEDEEVAEAVLAVEEAAGGLHVLVNSAGVWDPRDTAVGDLDVEVWERTLAVNLSGVYHTCKHAVPAMERAGRGSVVNVSSVVALRPEPVYAAYTASKGGVIALTLSIAQHYAHAGVRANVLLPGAIETAMTREAFAIPEYRERALSHTPIGRVGQPEDLAYAALYLAADDAAFVTGAVLPVDGGWLLAD
jgi:NAD(P)-dependent dehydrogenase (short-subunit alcohol dehydrogenase family)